MAKWRRGGGGRRGRGRWVIEYVPKEEEAPTVNGQLPMVNEEPDPFSFDTPEAIRAALARLDQRLLEEKRPIVDG